MRHDKRVDFDSTGSPVIETLVWVGADGDVDGLFDAFSYVRDYNWTAKDLEREEVWSNGRRWLLHRTEGVKAFYKEKLG